MTLTLPDSWLSLIERHRPSPATSPVRGPSLKRHDPDATQSLLLRVDVGWVHDELRSLIVVGPQHTWQDLGDLIASTVFVDVSGNHRDEFLIQPDGTGAQDHRTVDTIVIALPLDGEGDEQDPPDSLRGGELTVAAMLGVGWHAWYHFDFCDDWFFSLRCLAGADLAIGSPHVVAPPLGLIQQYPEY